MTDTKESLQQLRRMLAHHLDGVRLLFRDEIRITLIIRNTAHADRDVVIGDDDPTKALSCVQALVNKASTIHVPADAGIEP